jgi:hypothetical protein
MHRPQKKLVSYFFFLFRNADKTPRATSAIDDFCGRADLRLRRCTNMPPVSRRTSSQVGWRGISRQSTPLRLTPVDHSGRGKSASGEVCPRPTGFPRKNCRQGVKAFWTRKRLKSRKSTQIFCEGAPFARFISPVSSGLFALIRPRGQSTQIFCEDPARRNRSKSRQIRLIPVNSAYF